MRNAGRRTAAAFALLVAAFLLLMAMNACIGSLAITPGDVLRIVLAGGADGTPAGNVIWKIRLPRLLAAAILGGARSGSGFFLQTVFRHPI